MAFTYLRAIEILRGVGLVLSLMPMAAQAAGPTMKEMRMDDRAPLAGLVEPINPDLARLIRDPATTVSRMPTPFLQHGLIFRVDWRGPHKPVAFTVGWAQPGNFTVLLSGNVPGFNELVTKAGMSLNSEEDIVSYAVTELEATRRFDETFKILHSFNDLRLMAGPTPAAQDRYRQIKAAYEARIEPPQSQSTSNGWDVPVYVLVRNDLCLFVVSIARDGTSTVKKTVLEANTPLLPVYG